MHTFFACGNIVKKGIRSIIIVLIIAVSIISCTYAYLDYRYFGRTQAAIEDVVNVNLNNIYSIRFDKYIYASTKENLGLYNLYMYIKNLEEVKYCGAYWYQEEPATLYASKELLDMCGIDEIKDGTVFLADSATEMGTIDISDYKYESFEQMIEANNVYITNGIINNFYFTIEDTYSNSIKNMIFDKAKELDIDIYGINSVADIMREKQRQTMALAGERYMLPIVLLICALMTLAIENAVTFVTDKKDMIVMLRCGYSRMDIVMIYLMEGFLKLIIAFICVGIYYFMNIPIVTMTTEALLFVIAVMSCMIVLSCIPVIIKIRDCSIAELTSEEQ